MRLWTLHPRYLDTQGLVALWREALLAQKVLQGLTRGYVHHPQLMRFRKQDDPVGAIVVYLRGVHQEATRRGYRFDITRIAPTTWEGVIQETTGQRLFEWHHLLTKTALRSPMHHATLLSVTTPDPHPLFTLIEGGINAWERAAKQASPG
ncbi:MAG: DNA lyase [Magnetococcales bacterium]|nr:DNA lyase [Magnetococcales bacterium]MBF0148744.1 DNA lyase [Magnetococcales bacterium]MBF0173767.1 DNA lyase [Magnetococcales bacterium]MBF0348568.1 DNA lyase [Magnetococcales bacterium]MBF0630295.1 DNA lyase [Magnetococcales bacterium]